MTIKQFEMTATQIAKIIGTVGSPLIVISELLKNAVDASAKNIDIFYNREKKLIIVRNDHKGFSINEIENLFMPGNSIKKTQNNLQNEDGMFFTGSKGLGLLSVFLLCEEATIKTSTSDDQKIHKIILNKTSGTIEDRVLKYKFRKKHTCVVMKNVNSETIDFLSSEIEVRKLRHICTHLYKRDKIPFPKILLHISGQETSEINFSSNFPDMLYDINFSFEKDTGKLNFACSSPSKGINTNSIVLEEFNLNNLQHIMLTHYGIKETIPTRTNDNVQCNFKEVPSFEGKIIVYEKNLAGSSLKAYGAGVNVYVNDFALYNYLAEENDWLGLADFSQRKKATRLKPHNVFGYVNFPLFNENVESLKLSNERADFIQDLTFTKLMYLLKGVVMFIVFNIDVADKNPKYKNTPINGLPVLLEGKSNNTVDIPSDVNISGSPEEKGNSNHGFDDEAEPEPFNTSSDENVEASVDVYSPEKGYFPQKNVQKRLEFTKDEGTIINDLKNVNNLCNKIYNIVFEMSKLDLNLHRYSIAFLYRALLESSTKYLSQHQPKVLFKQGLEDSIVNALNYFSQISKKDTEPTSKTIQAWRDVVSKRKLIDRLNESLHNTLPVDASYLQETWSNMKSYVIACLTIK